MKKSVICYKMWFETDIHGKGKALFRTVFGTNLNKAHILALLALEQSLLNVCLNQDEGEQMTV